MFLVDIQKKYVLPFFFFFLFHLFKIGGNPVGPIFGDGGDMNTQQGGTHPLLHPQTNGEIEIREYLIEL